MLVSRCHNAELIVVKGDSMSAYYVCNKCGKPAEPKSLKEIDTDAEV